MNLGAFGEAGSEAASVIAPPECREGSLAWQFSSTFEDGTGLHEENVATEATSACPTVGTRAATTTSITASDVQPANGEAITYTATVAPKAASPTVPSGRVRFFDGGVLIPGCEGLPVLLGTTSSAANCHTSPGLGTHSITAVYGGDSSFQRSEATAVTVTVRAANHETEGRQKAEAEKAERIAKEEAVRRAERELRGRTIAALEQTLAPKGRAARLRKLLELGHYTFAFANPSTGTLVVRWYALSHGARRGRLTLVASGRASFAKTGPAKITVRLTVTGRRLLRRARHPKLISRATFTASGAPPLSAEGTFVLNP